MKNYLLVLLSIVICLSTLSSCNSNLSHRKTDNSDEHSLVLGNGNSADRNEITLDLSQFEEHGEWSDGLIWGKTKHDDWEEGTTYTFAYYNEQGTKVSQDFDSETYKAVDSENGWVVINNIIGFEYDSRGTGEKYEKLVYYSENFKFICSIYCYYTYLYPNGEFCLSKQEDRIYFVGAFESYADNGLYCLNKDGSYVQFILPEDKYATDFYEDDLSVSEYDSGHYYIGDDYLGLGTNFEYIFDDDGHLVLDFTKTKIDRIYNINFISNNNIEVSFIGADSNYYICTMDLQGNIIKEPTLE